MYSAEGFSPQPQRRSRPYKVSSLFSNRSSNNGPEKPGGGEGDGGDNGSGISEYQCPKPESVAETKQRVDLIDHCLQRM